MVRRKPTPFIIGRTVYYIFFPICNRQQRRAPCEHYSRHRLFQQKKNKSDKNKFVDELNLLQHHLTSKSYPNPRCCWWSLRSGSRNQPAGLDTRTSSSSCQRGKRKTYKTSYWWSGPPGSRIKAKIVSCTVKILLFFSGACSPKPVRFHYDPTNLFRNVQLIRQYAKFRWLTKPENV